MQSGAGAIAQSVKALIVAALLIVGVVIATGDAVFAVASSKVQSIVNSGTLHPALTLTDPASPATVTTMPLALAGELSSLTQIQIYVDDAFSVTVPLDESATTFSASIIIPTGTHTVKLVGISPFADITPTVEVTATYTPESEAPEEPNVPSTNSGDEQVGSRGGATITSGGDSSTSYTPPAPHTALPTWFYNGLVALDLAAPSQTATAGSESIKTAQRVLVTSSGLFMLVFSRAALFAYHQVRYTWLGLRVGAMPKVLSAHPLALIRTLGIMLVGSVFFLL